MKISHNITFRVGKVTFKSNILAMKSDLGKISYVVGN